jgi:hypothetical protein
VVGLVLTLVLGFQASALAQGQPVTAEITRVAGAVEVLPKGPPATQWKAATQGTQLGDGDQIRALSGGSAELTLPDKSTILVAENTRFAVTRLEHDPTTGTRTSAFHLVVGKVRADVTRAAVQLVRTRQSNFSISTPQGVAAVRGTRLLIAYDSTAQAPSSPGAPAAPGGTPGVPPPGATPPGASAAGQGILLCLPSPGQTPPQAQCSWLEWATQNVLLLIGNQFIRLDQSLAPGSIASLALQLGGLLGATNPQTEFAPELTSTNVFLPTMAQIQAGLLASSNLAAAAALPSGSTLFGGPGQQFSNWSPTSVPLSTARDVNPTGLSTPTPGAPPPPPQ